MEHQNTWFITGISPGFGRNLNEKLLDRGERVAATLHKVNALDDLKARYGNRLWVAALDVTDAAALRRVVTDAFEALGRIDVVVNEVSYDLFDVAEEVSEEQVRQQFDTNLIGSIGVIRAVLPHLRAQGGGRIFQLSTEKGQSTYPALSLYHDAKWGIEWFVEAVAQDVAPFNIQFTIVEPGPSKTNFGGGLVIPPKPAYGKTPADEAHQLLNTGMSFLPGDPDKMVDAMLNSIDRNPAPRRITLGCDVYNKVRGLWKSGWRYWKHKKLLLSQQS